jgi:hypothetical protein
MKKKIRSDTEISIKYLNGLVATRGNSENRVAATTVTAEMVSLGYIPGKDLFDVMRTMSIQQLEEFSKQSIRTMKAIKGANVKYVPMYPNFPEQVMEASDVELYINAILHYITMGEWLPEYTARVRIPSDDAGPLTVLGLVDPDHFHSTVIKRILSSRDSITSVDKEVVSSILKNDKTVELPDNIPFKENMCFLVGELILHGVDDISPVVTTATDVLRIAIALSNGDISLASNTKFKSFNRKTRKLLINALERVATLEDLNRHRGKWIRLFHILHVGEYSRSLYEMAKKVRENCKIKSFNSKLNKAIEEKNVSAASALLVQRPGEFARRLDHVLRTFTHRQPSMCALFGTYVNKVPTRNLLQLLGHMRGRLINAENRVVFPKGSIQRARIIEPIETRISSKIILRVIGIIESQLINRFSVLPPLGKVYIDPSLMSCPVPTQMRNVSEGITVAARGTHIPLHETEKDTIRLFIYWVGMDIDLSATFHADDFSMTTGISYMNLRDKSIGCYHSGDIVSASRGACEFIDVNIPTALKANHRYLVMNVNVFNGPTFKEHEVCYAGWMLRNKVQSGEVFEPKTVEQKIDLTMESRTAVPVIFDLKERQVIVTDLPGFARDFLMRYPNNIKTNAASIEHVLQAITSLSNRASLHDLLSLHIKGRGEFVDTKEEADIVFGFDGDVTPYDVSVINSEYVV